MDDWLVWSEEHGSWWRAGQRGYTTSILQAGMYTRVQADRIVREANDYSATINEIAVIAPKMLRPSHEAKRRG